MIRENRRSMGAGPISVSSDLVSCADAAVGDRAGRRSAARREHGEPSRHGVAETVGPVTPSTHAGIATVMLAPGTCGYSRA